MLTVPTKNGKRIFQNSIIKMFNKKRESIYKQNFKFMVNNTVFISIVCSLFCGLKVYKKIGLMGST